ncbi:unnamed protein product, partial [Candidula unifasciata]
LIYGLTSNKVRGDWCESTVINSGSSNLTTIRIPVNNVTIAQMSSGECAGQQLGVDTFTWAIVLKEFDGLLQELDVKINVTCDFSMADNLARSGEFSTGGEGNQIQEMSIIPESTHDDVLLHVIKASSGESVSEAAIGSDVILEIQYALLQGLCQVTGSPVRSLIASGEKNIKTPFFKLFAFEGETSVTFRCDRQTEAYQPARPPAAPPAYDMGPLVYVNPVTCSLFLLILLVFLCMYIAFIRTLRKSVYDIRKEIEVRRSRDKFLHCGCVQQKDKDYVAP